MELKPCPFCGIVPTLHHQKDDNARWESWFIRCDGKDCRMWVIIDAIDRSDINNIITIWNTRKGDDQ